MKKRNLEQLEEQLNSFNSNVRKEALLCLASDYLSVCSPQSTEYVNMHFHSFFSYNSEGWSPSRIVWEARKLGLHAVGLCDFDVLDGLEEFICAGCVLGVHTSVYLETRAFVKEYTGVEINSPGEAGVAYVMASGVPYVPVEALQESLLLKEWREYAEKRNKRIIELANACMQQIAIDYEKDVVSLSPSRTPTERHIVKAYLDKARSVFADAGEVVQFWASIFSLPFDETVSLMADSDALENTLRSKLIKRGGIAYEPASPEKFPPLNRFFEWSSACGAIPTFAWLDGTSEGERDAKKLIEYMTSTGAQALNIIPDRNWNMVDHDEQKRKITKLDEIIKIAEIYGLPINIGTEMNKHGQPIFDNLDCPFLQPYKRIFLKGADILVGHTLLARYAEFPYSGKKACAEFRDVKRKNAFFEAVGKLPPLDVNKVYMLKDMGTEKAFAWFHSQLR